MPFERDDALIASLRAVHANVAVLDALERTSAHSDIGELLFRFARSTADLRVIPLSTQSFPALVATRAGDERIVAAATGMQWLLVRTRNPPEGARLPHEPAPDLEAGWWRVVPFARGLSAEERDDELQRWFTAANTEPTG